MRLPTVYSAFAQIHEQDLSNNSCCEDSFYRDTVHFVSLSLILFCRQLKDKNLAGLTSILLETERAGYLYGYISSI